MRGQDYVDRCKSQSLSRLVVVDSRGCNAATARTTLLRIGRRKKLKSKKIRARKKKYGWLRIEAKKSATTDALSALSSHHQQIVPEKVKKCGLARAACSKIMVRFNVDAVDARSQS